MSRFEPEEKSYWLARLCEENYARLVRLIPDLRGLAKSAVARAEGKPSLHLELLESSPYTVTLELGHCFGREPPALLEPAVKIRIYLDACAAEVLSEHERQRPPRRPAPAREAMDRKWTLNYFLSQWLEHCLACNYRFGAVRPECESCGEAAA